MTQNNFAEETRRAEIKINSVKEKIQKLENENFLLKSENQNLKAQLQNLQNIVSQISLTKKAEVPNVFRV